MEDANTPSLLVAVRILAREGTLDARLGALAREARAVSGGVGALTLLRDVDGDTFATPAGEPVALDAPDLAALRDAAEERRVSWSSALPGGLASLAGAEQGSILPLVTANGAGPVVQGVMLVGGGSAASESVRETLGALADLAAVAVEHERLRAALDERNAWQERLARTDHLTGLADRMTFLQMLELEVVRATRQGTALAVVLFAVNDLGRFSETHGGRVADDILRLVAATLADRVRLVDTIARLGPDEMGVIAPGDPAGTVARRVIEALAMLPAIEGITPDVRAGIAHHPVDGTDANELLGGAQRALSQARAGSVGAIVGLREGADSGIAPTS
jgi:diguanylate cyclase (GGDEF)-like protein